MSAPTDLVKTLQKIQLSSHPVVEPSVEAKSRADVVSSDQQTDSSLLFAFPSGEPAIPLPVSASLTYESIPKADTKSQSLMQQKLTPEPINLIGSFLKDPELVNLRKTAKFLRASAQNEDVSRKENKRRTEFLLRYVFEANTDAIRMLFKKPDANPELILTQTCFRQGFQSKQFNKFMCLTEWGNVSAIQAAIDCGDEFLLMDLLALIEHDEELRSKALAQLKEVEKRISQHAILATLMSAIEPLKEMMSRESKNMTAAKLRLNEILQTKEFQRLINDFLSEMEELRGQWTEQTKTQAASSNPKSKEETKKSSEKTHIKFGEEMEFFAPVLRLIKAYLCRIIHLLPPQFGITMNPNRGGEDWVLVGECLKRLSHYFKQELFDKTPSFRRRKAFSTVPDRGPCRNQDGVPMDLDKFGFGAGCAIVKGERSDVLDVGPPPKARLMRPVPFIEPMFIDLVNMFDVYKLRLKGLQNIIERLETAAVSKITCSIASKTEFSKM